LTEEKRRIDEKREEVVYFNWKDIEGLGQDHLRAQTKCPSIKVVSFSLAQEA
jgi:hypothetical protein